MDLGLKDKVIVAMGGTSNLGKGACIELCREGAKVMAGYHKDDEKAHKTQDLIRAEGGEYEGIDAYIPRSGNPNDEVFNYNEETRTTIAELWSKVKIAASDAK